MSAKISRRALPLLLAVAVALVWVWWSLTWSATAGLSEGGPSPGLRPIGGPSPAPRPTGDQRWLGLDDSPARPVPRPDEPLDVVLRWVNGSDPAWLARKRAAQLAEDGGGGGGAASRWFDNDELKFAIRSLEKHGRALNVRRVWVLASEQVPAWLRADNPWVTFVQESEVAPPWAALPTFNSNALAVLAGYIPGLAEHYLLWDDDNVLSRATDRSLWFDGERGEARFYVESYGSGCHDAYSCSLKRSTDLLSQAFGHHHRGSSGHLPTVQNRKVLRDMEARWPDAFRATLAHRFRHREDINVQLMLPWYMADAGLGARAEPVRSDVSQVIGLYSKGRGVQNPSFHKVSRERLEELFARPHVVCFNNGDVRVPEFVEWLEGHFGEPSVAEVSGRR